MLSGERAVLCRLRHPLANATSLKQLQDAQWITTSITPRAENEIGDLFKAYGLPDPALAMQCQSALTLLTCLTNTDLLAMAPAQWTASPIANRLLTTIPVEEELSAAPIILVTRTDAPLAPAASLLLDLMQRTVSHGAKPGRDRAAAT